MCFIDYMVSWALTDYSTWSLPLYGWWRGLNDFLLWFARASVSKWTHPKPVNSSKFHKVMARLCTAIPHQLYFSALHTNACSCLNSHTNPHTHVLITTRKHKHSSHNHKWIWILEIILFLVSIWSFLLLLLLLFISCVTLQHSPCVTLVICIRIVTRLL